MRIEAIQLAPTEAVPNHPRFPALIYRGVLEGAADPALTLELTFGANGWPPQWRNGIYRFHHYHTLGHEALGCAAGTARVMLGGPEGTEVAVAAGDVMVLPVGTGHCLVEGSADLLIVGAYPPGQTGDICRGPPTEEMRERIGALPAPPSDPLGAEAGVTELWRGDEP
jgi:uncharacterized protein YjlB